MGHQVDARLIQSVLSKSSYGKLLPSGVLRIGAYGCGFPCDPTEGAKVRTGWRPQGGGGKWSAGQGRGVDAAERSELLRVLYVPTWIGLGLASINRDELAATIVVLVERPRADGGDGFRSTKVHLIDS